MKHAIVLAILVVLAGVSVAAAGDESATLPPSAVHAAVLQSESARIAVMDRAKESVLVIFAPNGKGGGSGVVISADGYALSNFHVTKPCGTAMRCGMADGRLYDAVIVGMDPTGDVALIKLFGRDDFPHAQLGDSDRVQVGDWCFAMGNPFLLASDFRPTVTYGIVSGVHRYQYPAGTLLEYADCLQIDASINPGNSGGPLFDAEGRLIGINGRGSFEKRGRVNVGVAYAISINQIKNFLGELRSGRIIDHATLGATVASGPNGRVLVDEVLEESDAYRRGLRYGDEIVSLGGRPISTPNGLKNALGICPKGRRVPLSYRREGERYDVVVRLAGVHGAEELLRKTEGRPRNVPMPIPEPEEPKDDEPQPDGPKPDVPPRPREGAPPPRHMIRAAVPIAEVVKEHFEAKRGYANYYFNKLHRDRVWKSWSARADFADCDGTWVLSGPLDGGGTFRFELTDADALLKLPAGETKWAASEDLGSALDPPYSGGLMPALHLWRRLAVVGPGTFGEVSYLGTLPLAGHQEPLEVLVGLHKGVECRFLFEAREGHLLAVEMFPADDVDPCEIFFSGYRELDGRFLPARMEVRHGGDLYGVFHFDQITFETPAAQ